MPDEGDVLKDPGQEMLVYSILSLVCPLLGLALINGIRWEEAERWQIPVVTALAILFFGGMFYCLANVARAVLRVRGADVGPWRIEEEDNPSRPSIHERIWFERVAAVQDIICIVICFGLAGVSGYICFITLGDQGLWIGIGAFLVVVILAGTFRSFKDLARRRSALIEIAFGNISLSPEEVKADAQAALRGEHLRLGVHLGLAMVSFYFAYACISAAVASVGSECGGLLFGIAGTTPFVYWGALYGIQAVRARRNLPGLAQRHQELEEAELGAIPPDTDDGVETVRDRLWENCYGMARLFAFALMLLSWAVAFGYLFFVMLADQWYGWPGGVAALLAITIALATRVALLPGYVHDIAHIRKETQSEPDS